ncbi:MAG TPA: hypothetical protein VFP39_16945, partial [Gemmatimonadales bacterium]|nr:hypothetical protein [Gemmatimonadales bacterium]
MLSDAIVALATPPGRSALALIRLSGRGAFDIGARVLHPFHADRPRAALRVAVRHPTTGEELDLGIAICYPGPASYTGEDQIEIATHGGLLVPGEVVAACVAAGA